MKNSCKILIVTPTLGTRQTLRETCKSVRDIGGDKVHHVVTCPQAAINTVSGMVEGVEIVEEGGGKGVYGAVNHVLKSRASNYDWVGYINDDDYWLPDMKGLIESAIKNSTHDILYGRVLFVNQTGQPLMVSSCSARYKSFPMLAARGIIMFTQQAALIRSNLFLRLGGFDESFRLAADTDFWIRAITGGARCRFIDKVCAAYRLQPGQLSADSKTQKAETDRILAQYGLRGNTWLARLEATRFRLENSKLYLTRLLRRGEKGYAVREHIG
jgi:GT2 family glycosyltransferase